MNGYFLNWEAFQALHQLLSLLRSASAHRIAQRHFVTAHVEELLSNSENFLGMYLALVGTTHDHRDVAPYFDMVLLGDVDDWDKPVQTLFD